MRTELRVRRVECLESRLVPTAPAYPTNIPAVLNNQELRTFVTRFETVNDTPNYFTYEDTVGNATIGIGSNIQGTPGSQKIHAVFGDTVSYAELIAGVDENGSPYGLNDTQIQRLFTYDLYQAYERAVHLFPHLSSMSLDQQIALIDFCFNTSNPGSFKNLITDVANEDWYDAGQDLVDSARYAQVAERSDAEIAFLQDTEYKGEVSDLPLERIDFPPILGASLSYDFTEVGRLEGKLAINSIVSGFVKVSYGSGTTITIPLTSSDDSQSPGEIDTTGSDGSGDTVDVFGVYQSPDTIPAGFAGPVVDVGIVIGVADPNAPGGTSLYFTGATIEL